MTVKATQFRQNLFQILDQCKATGKPVRIERGDDVYELVPQRKKMLVEDLEDHPGTVVGDLDTLPLVKAWEWDPDEEMREHGLS